MVDCENAEKNSKDVLKACYDNFNSKNSQRALRAAILLHNGMMSSSKMV